MSTSVIQKITNSKPFKIYSTFCLVRGIAMATATACYITFSIINENRRENHQPTTIYRKPTQATPYKTEPHEANPYQCPYQTHFRDESAAKLY